jgi:hypothetical protein
MKKKKLKCFSCKVAVDAVDDLCHGCKRLTCRACVFSYGHFNGGDHGKKAKA